MAGGSARRSRGFLIVLEGVDKAGKETQLQLLRRGLEKRGFTVTTISFPDYGTPLGKLISNHLRGNLSFPDDVFHLLLAANRWERRGDIEKWLSRGMVVLANRYSPSNLAYGSAKGLPVRWLGNCEKGLPEPDLVLVIDVDPSVSLARQREGRDIHEGSLALLGRARRLYLKFAQRFGWVVVSGLGQPKVVHRRIWRVISSTLKVLA